MDLKVYKKERILQPSGEVWVYVPDVIDIQPVFEDTENADEGGEVESGILTNASTVEDYADVIEQATTLSSIWQRGLDPLDTSNGNRWSELFLGEINVLQIMEDIQESVSAVSPSVTVEFSTTTDDNGNSYFTYQIKAVS